MLFVDYVEHISWEKFMSLAIIANYENKNIDLHLNMLMFFYRKAEYFFTL
jgi:hypothetical protein